tara:strand:- start:153 stop:488 length:336 start_codon:yes stop_codon:yes gene_type:complete
MRTNQATATINKEVDINVGNSDFHTTYLVGFEITANIDVGSKDSWDTPGEPPSVDEWFGLKIQYIHLMNETSLTFGVLHNSDHKLFEKHILELAEVAGMEWVDDYDEEEYE